MIIGYKIRKFFMKISSWIKRQMHRGPELEDISEEEREFSWKYGYFDDD